MRARNPIVVSFFLGLTLFCQTLVAKDIPPVIDKAVAAAGVPENVRREFDSQNELYRKQKELYDEWLRKPSLRTRWIANPQEPAALNANSKYPAYQVPSKNIEFIEKIISLVEEDNFSMKAIAKKTGLKFETKPGRYEIFGDGQAEVWAGSFTNTARPKGCGVRRDLHGKTKFSDMFWLETIPHFGMTKLAGGTLRYLSIPVDLIGWKALDKKQFEFYKNVFPAVSDYDTPFDDWHVAPMLNWLYLEQLDQTLARHKHWGHSFHPEARFNLSKEFATQQVFLPWSFEQSKSYKGVTEYFGDFAAVAAVKGLGNAVAARAIIDERARTFLGKNGVYKVYFDGRRVNVVGSKKEFRCTRVVIEFNENPSITGAKTSLDPKSPEEIFTYLKEFSFNKIHPTISFYAERSSGDSIPSVYELKTSAQTSPEALHNLKSTAVFKRPWCLGIDSKKEKKNLEYLEDCIRYKSAEYSLIELVPPIVSGTGCIKPSVLKDFLTREIEKTWAPLKVKPHAYDHSIRSFPSDKGLGPYGIQKDTSRGIPYVQTIRLQAVFSIRLPWVLGVIQVRGSSDCVQSVRMVL